MAQTMPPGDEPGGSYDEPTDTSSGRRRAGGLYRSRTNRMLGGVCGGIAEYFGSDPTLVRLVAVVLAILTGVVPLLLAYFVALFIIPEGDGATISARPADGATLDPGQIGILFGVLLIGIGLVSFLGRVLNIEWSTLWPLLLVVVGGVIVASSVRR